MTISDERLEEIYGGLANAECIHQIREVLTSLADDELEATYCLSLTQYAQELALGALERSEYLCGTLVINANMESIEFTRMALDAMRCEIEARKHAEQTTSPAQVN